MAALNFPTSPNIGDIYTPAGVSQSYIWTGTVWKGAGVNLNYVSRNGDYITGPLYLPNGSVGVPALSLSNEQNTGFYYRTGAVCLSTLATETVTVAYTGAYAKLGINNTTPTAQIDVKSSGDTTILLTSSGQNSMKFVSASGGTNDIYSLDSGGNAAASRFFVGSAIAYQVDTSLRFGIGGSPATKLDVQSTSGTNIIRSFSTAGTDARLIAKNSSSETIFGSDAIGSYIAQASALAFRVSVNNTEALRILSDGSFGLGETTTDSFINITGVKSSNIAHLRASSGGTYNGIYIQTETLGGQNGGIRILPNTTPGGGSAEFTTRFSSNTSGGTVNHNVVVDSKLSVGGTTTFTNTDVLILPRGTNAQRGALTTAGQLRYNTDTKVKEVYREQFGWTPIIVRAGNNEILNGDFSVWERGTTFNAVANNAVTADMWRVLYNGTGLTRNITSIDDSNWNGTTGVTPTGATAPTFLPVNGLRWSQSGTPSGVTYNLLRYAADGVTMFNGHNYVTLSFFARTSTGSAFGNIYATQKFNSGAGGSADVYVPISSGTVSLTGSWVRYAFTFAVPSTVGKTYAAGNQLAIDFLYPMTAGSHTIDIASVKLEAGGAATLGWGWRENSYSAAYAECRRYFYKESRSLYIEGNATSASCNRVSEVLFPLAMRTAPTIVAGPTFNNTYNVSSTLADNITYQGYRARIVSASSGFFSGQLVGGSLHLSAELPVL